MYNKDYYKTAINLIPQDIVDKYDLIEKKNNGYAYVRVENWMYGLVQSGIIANMELKEHLLPFGYAPSPITSGLWKHNEKYITFTLVLYDFGIK